MSSWIASWPTHGLGWRALAAGTLSCFPASRATINVVAPMKEGLPMFSRRLTKWIAVVTAVIVVGGGAYGIVSATSSSGSGSASAAPPAQVIPFTRGQPSPAQVVGQVPQDYSPGSGTIVTGTAADTAQAAAVAAYPGGTIDRVVL